MRPQLATYLGTAFPVMLVIAGTVIAVIAISAWLVRDVAHKALDRTSPERVPAVVLALGSLLRSLPQFLPWSSRLGNIDEQVSAAFGLHDAVDKEQDLVVQKEEQ
jgi:nitrate/nitrite transporter NarK